jgi:hypothetical protein
MSDILHKNIPDANFAIMPKDILTHGPLKLRTVHLRDNTINYESKVSVQNVFPLFKGTIMSRPHKISDQ